MMNVNVKVDEMIKDDLKLVKSLVKHRNDYKYFYPWLMMVSDKLKNNSRLNKCDRKEVLKSYGYQNKYGIIEFGCYIRLLVNLT